MGLPLVVEPGDGRMETTVEFIGIHEGAVGEVVPLEIAPTMLDRIQLRRILGQPLKREPWSLGEGSGRKLAGMDRPVVEDNDQRFGTLMPAIGSAEVIEQVDKIP